jgi:BolA protein
VTYPDVVAAMREHLAALQPSQLAIRDDSAHHAGHAGARGGGHFAIMIVSPRFAGKRNMERHRMVYDALGAMMRSEIHALSIDAKTPEETTDLLTAKDS